MASPWALAGQEGLEAIEHQRPAERREEPALNDFIRKSFRFVEWLRSMAAVSERRNESFTRGKIYFARGALDCPRGNLQSLEHIYPYYTLPQYGIPSGTEGFMGQSPRGIEVPVGFTVTLDRFVDIDSAMSSEATAVSAMSCIHGELPESC